ncbi:hypothetical protein RvY_16533 [Ramazzottius varieornatus]|uniref:Zinc finger Ran-binding domain-containing protein 2 n=1 Tax=Ramazzottius varieornatus TaxID=947166 RepID=A0A1D1VYT1_RAMVA|nr:hypothetical protein RvY_16533 [Ramazzottius varieornatus]
MAAARPGFKPGFEDWECPDCANINFGKRQECNRCRKPKPDDKVNIKKTGIEIGKQAAEKSKGLFSADDWMCTKCGNVNWARRKTCNTCNAPKFTEVEIRTGLGGGFNEREGVEYKEKADSDDEFDDFGRRKKKFKNQTSGDDKTSAPSASDKTSADNDEEKESEDEKEAVKEKDDEEEDDDDEDGDVAKYNLDDDEDDEDMDIAKYNLDDDEEEDVPKKDKEASS